MSKLVKQYGMEIPNYLLFIELENFMTLTNSCKY